MNVSHVSREVRGMQAKLIRVYASTGARVLLRGVKRSTAARGLPLSDFVSLKGLALGLTCAFFSILLSLSHTSALATTIGSVSAYTKIAHNTNGGPSLANGDWFGYSVAAIGDLNRDGIQDLAIGAPEDDSGGANSLADRGAVYVAFMNANGTIASRVKLAHLANGGPTLANSDWFGVSVAGIGDLNRDGIPDLAIGASGDDTGGFSRGAVYIAFMNASGSIASTVKLAHNLNGGPTLTNGDSFGRAVAGIGDLNRDGIPDLAIGASADSTGGSGRGAVYVAFMNTNGSIASTVKLAHNLNGGPALANSDSFGRAVAGIGDLNRDGIPDLAIGATGDDTGGASRGAVYVAFMNASGTIASKVKLADSLNGGPPLIDSDYFGSAVASIGDLNRDGIPDLAIGVSGADPMGINSNRGLVYVAFMNASGAIASMVALGDHMNGGPTVANDDFFGSAVAGIGDLDRDGAQDLAVGAYGDETGGTDRGAIYILNLNGPGALANPGALSNVKLANNTNGGPTLVNDDKFGSAAVEIGDLNRDGIPDLAIGAIGDSTGGPSRGAVYIAFMNTNGRIAGKVKLAHNSNGGPALVDSDYFGCAVAAIGDLNRDGIPDLAIGAYGDDTGGANRGAVYIAFMNASGSIASRVELASGLNGGPTLVNSDNFGMAVAGIGDLNRDGIPDLAISAPYDDTGGTNRGAVYVAFMNTSGSIASTVKLAHNLNGAPALVDGDNFGYAVAQIGDLNRDGIPDLAIGARADDSGGTDRGAVYVAFMNANGSIASKVKVAHNSNGGPALTDGDFFGGALAGIDDLNRDGLPDLAIGAYSDDTGGVSRGAVYLAFMNTSGTIASSAKLASATNGGPTLVDNDLFGSAVAAIGDLNRNGVQDIVIGAPYDGTGGSSRGAAYVSFLGSLPSPTSTPTNTRTNTPTYTRTNTPTASPTVTSTPTRTFTATNTRTNTPTPTSTYTRTNTPTPTNTPLATTRLVSTLGTDSGDCTSSPCATIAYAIAQAWHGDTISIAAGSYAQRGIIVNKNLTISGAGALNTVVDVGGTETTKTDHVFTVNSGVTAAIQNLTISGGSPFSNGGGIYNNGTLTLNDTEIKNNYAFNHGGGIYNYNTGVLVVRNSAIIGNMAGSVATPSNGSGGGIFNDSSGAVTFENLTLSGNKATYSGGSIFSNGNVGLNNVTIANNVSDYDNNNSGSGGGLAINSGNASLANSIVAGNLRGSSATYASADCLGTMTSEGYNLVGSGTGCPGGGVGDQTVTPADVFTTVLGPLFPNGGSTQTHALLTGSPAIDAGDPSAPGNRVYVTTQTRACEANDQRGIARPLDGNGDGNAICDSGAYEASAANTPTPTPTQTDTPMQTSTPTATPTRTSTANATPTQTSTNTPTNTRIPTDTPTRTLTPTRTRTPTRTATRTKTPTLTPTPPTINVENGDYRIEYDGWHGVKDLHANGRAYRMSNTANDSITFKFTGTSVKWVTRKGPAQGMAQVTIDGAPRCTCDLYNATDVWNTQQSFSGLASQAHTLVITVLGTKNASATDTNVVIDAFIVGATRTQDSANAVQYNQWQGAKATAASGGAYRANGSAGATVRLTFTGTAIDWITAKGPAYGQAEVYIDGALAGGTVDLYDATLQWNVAIPFTGLGAGQHKIEIRPLGSKNAASTGTSVVVDAFRGQITAEYSGRQDQTGKQR